MLLSGRGVLRWRTGGIWLSLPARLAAVARPSRSAAGPARRWLAGGPARAPTMHAQRVFCAFK